MKGRINRARCHLRQDKLRTTLRAQSLELWLWLAIDPATTRMQFPALAVGLRILAVSFS